MAGWLRRCLFWGARLRKGGDPVPLWKLGDTTEPAAFKKLINRMLEAKFLPE